MPVVRTEVTTAVERQRCGSVRYLFELHGFENEFPAFQRVVLLAEVLKPYSNVPTPRRQIEDTAHNSSRRAGRRTGLRRSHEELRTPIPLFVPCQRYQHAVRTFRWVGG